jgi:hypothetical protein
VPKYAPCPNCSATRATDVGYTWWGGALGPRLLTHVRCGACGTQYNGKTGKSNTSMIVAYFAVLSVVTLVLVVIIFGGKH